MKIYKRKFLSMRSKVPSSLEELKKEYLRNRNQKEWEALEKELERELPRFKTIITREYKFEIVQD